MSGIIAFFRASPPKAGAAFDEHRFRRVRWQTFIAMTLAYVTFYVCRLSFTVAKSALVELGITPTELGMIGSTLFFSYAIGKLVNGFIADHANVVRYMSLGLLLSAGMNLMMGMTTNALLLANACFDTVHKIGMPEARITLAETTIYLATSPKSNSAYMAINQALSFVEHDTTNRPVPLHLRNAPTKLMDQAGYGKGYKYAHDYGGFAGLGVHARNAQRQEILRAEHPQRRRSEDRRMHPGAVEGQI